MNTNKLLAVARRNLGDDSNARLCIERAISAVNDMDLPRANYWALRSIAWSIGICHSDYAKAWKYAGNKGNITLPFVPDSMYIRSDK